MMTNKKIKEEKRKGKRKGKIPLLTPPRSEFFAPDVLNSYPSRPCIFNHIAQFIHSLKPHNNLTYIIFFFFSMQNHSFVEVVWGFKHVLGKHR